MRLDLGTTVDLEKIKIDARRRVDLAAEAVRQRYVTPGEAKMMVYIRKAEQASLYLSNPNVALTRIPLIADEASDNGETIQVVAERVRAKEAQWMQLARVIERKQLRAHKEIEAAKSPMEIEQAANVNWTLGG